MQYFNEVIPDHGLTHISGREQKAIQWVFHDNQAEGLLTQKCKHAWVHPMSTDVECILKPEYLETCRDLEVSWVAAAQGRSFLLESPDSWMIERPLGPTVAVAALTGPRPFNATFCFRCLRTWRARCLGDAVCEYPHRRPNQVKCRLCSESRHPCLPVRVSPLSLVVIGC